MVMYCPGTKSYVCINSLGILNVIATASGVSGLMCFTVRGWKSAMLYQVKKLKGYGMPIATATACLLRGLQKYGLGYRIKTKKVKNMLPSVTKYYFSTTTNRY